MVRTALAFGRPTPLYYPDEYLYSSLARSIASSGLPAVRGGSAHFPALLGPYLMAPAWLVHNVDVAYRLALGWASLWFCLAALPAYALARRIGVEPRKALFVAAVALLVPDAAFTTTLLSEPFAYPVFLTTVLLAVETAAFPTRRRQLLLLGSMAALVLLRLQFVVVPIAYVVACLGTARTTPRTFVRRQPIVAGALAALALGALAVGPQRVAGVYAGVGTMHLPALDVARWLGLDAFVLAIASGWVLVPGAVAGLVESLRGIDLRQRAFALLTVTLSLGLVAQAAFFGANEDRIHERYVFYVAPLVALAFASRRPDARRTRLPATIGYCAAAAALLLPLATGLRAAVDDESPSLLGLGTLAGGGDRGTLLWAVGLALLALGVGLGVIAPRVVPATSLLLLAAVGSAGTVSLLGFGTALGWRLNLTDDVPRLHARPGTALVTLPTSNRFLLMKTLFWNPQVTRVLVLGRGPAADGWAATDVRLNAQGLVGPDGRPVRGPFAFDTDTTALVGPGSARVFLFGLNRTDHYLETLSRLDVAAGERPVEVGLRLVSPSGAKRIALRCGGKNRVVTVGTAPTQAVVPVPKQTVRTCRITLVGGSPVVSRGRTVSVQGHLWIRGARTRAGKMPAASKTA